MLLTSKRCESRNHILWPLLTKVSSLEGIIRIREDCSPEVAAATLDILYKEMKNPNLKRNGKRPLRGGEADHDDVETAIIQALAPLENTLGFGRVISKTNDYKQTLAHFAVHFGYATLLRRLVGWNIDLSIADVNGFTALHCAYKMGDRACVDLLLENGAPETVLDTLGRAPSQLMPDDFASLSDHDAGMTSDYQADLEQPLDAPSLFQSTNSGHGVSELGDEMSMDIPCAVALMPQSQSSSTSKSGQNNFSPSGTRVVVVDTG
jgi:ankyrin repeat protein